MVSPGIFRGKGQLLPLPAENREKETLRPWQGLHGKDSTKSTRGERGKRMTQKKAPTQPGGGPVYSLRKNGVVCCQSSLADCGYSAGMLKELRAAGYELYRDGKKVWRSKV